MGEAVGSARSRGWVVGSEHAEGVAVEVGHHDPPDVTLADVDANRPQRLEAFDLALWSTPSGGATSKWIRSLPSFGISGGPLQVIFGRRRRARIAVSWS